MKLFIPYHILWSLSKVPTNKVLGNLFYKVEKIKKTNSNIKKYLFFVLFKLICLSANAQLIAASMQGATFLSKELNNALDFDGIDDCVITTLDVNNTVMPITTWEAWVYPTADDANWRTIFGIEDGNWDRNVFINGSRFWAGHGCNGWNITDINLNEWQHIAIVYDEVNGRMVFYKNGVAFTKNSNVCTPSSAVKFGIGSSQQSGPNQFFKGKITDVRVWNIERTQAQIQANMNTELIGNEIGLISYYPFKQGVANGSNTNTVLYDEVGAYNGTITNFALSGTSSNFIFGKVECRIPKNNLLSYVNVAMKRSYAGSGTVMNDLTLNNNSVSLIGSPPYFNTYGGVLSLDGPNSYLQTTNVSPIAGTNKRTIAMWFLPRNVKNANSTNIINTGGTTYNTGMFGVYAGSTNLLSFWGHNSDFSTSLTLKMNEWNFLAVTYDGIGQIKLHLNGTTASAGRTLNTISNKISILGNVPNYFGEMMIYDRDLSQSDLVYLYERSKIKYAPKDGLTAATAALSAQAIKAAYPNATDGVYWINLPTVGVQQVYCLMDSKYDGGGWMLAMKATTGTTFNYSANYWYTANTLNATDLTRNDADAKYDVMNYFPVKDLFAVWPDIPNSGTESGSIDNLTNWTWLQNNFHSSGQSTTLISKFAASPTQSTFQTNTTGSITFSGYGTPFSSQSGFAFYGFNYTGNAGAKVRWGFSWNQETDQLTNDVSGGIGLTAGSYSAGDVYGCCGNNTGINRSARVELYVR